MEEEVLKQEEWKQTLEENERKLQEMEQKIADLEKKGKKKRKGWKTVLIVIGVILAIMAVITAVLFAMMNGDKESPAMAEQVVQAIIEGDGDAAYELMYPGLMERKEFQAGFVQLCQLWRESGGGDTFTLKRQGWALQWKNGVKQYTTNFEVTSGDAVFDFELVRAVQGDTAGMLGAHMNRRLPK